MCTEVFITDIRNEIEIENLLKLLTNSFADLKIDFDLNDSQSPYPCGHTIMRVTGQSIDSVKIVSLVHVAGFMCGILEDKICK